MTARFSPPLFHSAAWMVFLVFLLNITSIFCAEYQGPVFPGERVADVTLNEPLPLPRANPLLQRPSNSKQVVFDNHDPVAPVVSHGLLHETEFEMRPQPSIPQNRTPSRFSPIIGTDNIVFMDNGECIQGGVWQQTTGCTDDEYRCGMNGYYSGPIPLTFGMGLFDNLTLFADTTAFKTELNNGMGSIGFGQGINWSTAVTPQGTITAQYGVRAVQGDMYSTSSRNQTFMTAGIFKRFPVASIQGGVAVDWLHDHSRFGSVDVRQMRCELSARSRRNLEYGFIGGFDAFRDRPTTQRIDLLARNRGLSDVGGAVDVQNYYLLFVRKHLANSQMEFRCGTTERGNFIMGALGEAAISDRLAVNGGITMLAPSGGKSDQGNYRESWSMSFGIVLYFRGGAMSRPANLHRPMFDVAGNNSFFTRIIGQRAVF